MLIIVFKNKTHIITVVLLGFREQMDQWIKTVYCYPEAGIPGMGDKASSGPKESQQQLDQVFNFSVVLTSICNSSKNLLLYNLYFRLAIELGSSKKIKGE